MKAIKYRSSIVLLLCVLSVAGAPARGQSQEFPVSTHTLKNGMKVLVQPDHSIPNVALYIFYRVGSRNEHPGTTGLSHFFEHMMFNGAKKYGPGELDKVMEANGGSNNAYTTQNVTVYQDWFPRSALPLIYDIEADRIRDLTFDPKKIASEREVVASERRLSVDNDNRCGQRQRWPARRAALGHRVHRPHVSMAGRRMDERHRALDDGGFEASL